MQSVSFENFLHAFYQNQDRAQFFTLKTHVMKKIALWSFLLIILLSCKKQTVNKPTAGGSFVGDVIELSPDELARRQAAGLVHTESGENVILVDFNGQYVWGTSWNVNGPFTCAPSKLSPLQRGVVFNGIKERYSTFNVLVDSNESAYTNANPYRRMRLIVTPTCQPITGTCNAGGIAVGGSFIFGDNTPCFVFDSCLALNTQAITVAGAHEVGHTLGLRHQAVYDANCVLINQYNPGNGTGATSWAPLMGVAYNKSISTFTVGPDLTACTPWVNEYSVINDARKGITQLLDKSDVVANSLPTDIILYNGVQYNGSLESPTDVDFFQVGPHANVYGIHVTVATYGTTDIAVDVYDNRGVLRGTIDPSGSADVPRTAAGGLIPGWAPQWIAIRNTSNNPNVPAGSLRGSYSVIAEY